MTSLYKTFCFCLLAAILLPMIGCDLTNKEPIRVGFVGTLTGWASVVGVTGREAAMIAIEQTNQQGGINGHNVELLTRDIQNDVTQAQSAVKGLINDNVHVIIGPMFSSMAVATAPVVNNSKTLIVSPTASTTFLSNKDDNFLRLYPPSDITAHRMANHVADKSLKRVTIICDASNKAFTEDWKNHFTNQLTARGGKIVDLINYVAGEEERFLDLATKVSAKEPTAILILANAPDTALFSQQFAKLGVNIPVFASEWSMTSGLVSSGGKTVEGIEFFHILDTSSQKQAYLDFIKAYKTRYNHTPSYPAILTYDAAKTVIFGLQKGARTGPELKQVLLKEKSIDTLQTTIRFNSFGDVERKLFLNVVKDGEIVSAQR